jgi:hypothetical protein
VDRVPDDVVPDDVVVVIRDPAGAPAGLGIFVDATRILTCAHVVEQALDRGAPTAERTMPTPGVLAPDSQTPDVRRGSDGGSVSGRRVRVEIVRRAQDGDHRLLDLVAPVSDWDPPEGGDLALLTLPKPAPDDVAPVRLVGRGVPIDQWPTVLRVFGYPENRPHGQWTEVRAIGVVDGGRVQLNTVDGVLPSVRAGYSGSPVQDPRTGAVVAVVTQAPAGGSSRESLAIPAPVLHAFLQSSVGGAPAGTDGSGHGDSGNGLPARRRGGGDASRRRPVRSYAPADELTVLHLSDLHFGSSHGFGGEGLTDGDHRQDTLIGRLHTDLGKLADAHGLWPDLVVATGDLTHQAAPNEFEQAGDFLAAVMDVVGLSRHRLVMVPGNHDINRAASRAYAADEESLGREPVPPFARKWRNYQTMFQRFYTAGPADAGTDRVCVRFVVWPRGSCLGRTGGGCVGRGRGRVRGWSSACRPVWRVV